MAVVAISDSILTDIADAIRSKNGTENTYKPAQMSDAIEAISGGGITPTGTINITQNGVVDVTNYASADVDVPTGSTPVINSLSVTENGTYTAPSGVDGYSPISVNVPSVSPSLGTKSITENGTYDADDDSLDGYSSVTVNVPTGGGGSDVSYTRYTLTGDTNIRNFLDSAQYQIKNPNALAICIMIRVSGTVAPSGGSYTLNNFVMLFGGTTLLYGKHRYQGGTKTPDSFPSLPSVNENNTTLSITNGILTSSTSTTATSCIGAAGDVVTIAEMPIPIDNTIMEGGTI